MHKDSTTPPPEFFLSPDGMHAVWTMTSVNRMIDTHMFM